jgi:ABC-type Zn uptake system ZnuABC Zn-binding protein ZnuA
MIVEPVVEGRGTVVTLLDPGDSPHTHDPRPSDLRAVQGSRALLFGAPMLDGWAADLPSDRRWALLDVVPATYRRAFGEDGLHASTASDGDANDEEAHSGKTHDGDAHDRDAHDGDAHGEHGPGSVDPHFWTDPLAVKALLPALVDSLCAADAEGCPVYRANADSFATDLEALDARLETMLRPVRHEPVMLAQPFFHYFAARYGPAVVAVVEPQPAKEPSPRQIQRLVRRAEADRVQAVFTQHQLPPRAAEVVAESASLPIHTLDPLGGTPGRRDYDALLLHNASVILSALQDG